MRVMAFLVALTIGGAAYANTQPSQPPIVELVRRSGFIFEGTIKRVGASTPTVPTQPNTLVVFVDEVLEALPPVENPKGHEVTVRVADPHHFYKGQRMAFFTAVYSAGMTLGVDAAGTLPSQSSHVLQAQIRAARQVLADEALSNRLASAQLVVTGTIGAAVSTTPRAKPPTFHDPFWSQRPIQVQTVEKGPAPGNSTIVNVSGADDEFWDGAPNPTIGAQGIFLMQPKPAKDFFSTATGRFLVDPLDFLPLSELPRVRRLLRSLP